MTQSQIAPDLGAAAAAAIKKAGGGSAVARELNITRSAVHLWKGAGIPAKHVAAVAALANLPAAALRPDLAAAFAPQVPA